MTLHRQITIPQTDFARANYAAKYDNREPTVEETEAATAEMQSFMLANPEVAFAETVWRGWRYTFRLIAVLDGDEYEGTGHTMAWALRMSADSKRHEAAFARNMAANPAMAGLVDYAGRAL